MNGTLNKIIVPAFVILVSGLTVWAAVRNVATTDEVSAQIAIESPWLPYERQVLSAVDAVSRMDDQLWGVRSELAVLTEKIDTLIKKLE